MSEFIREFSELYDLSDDEALDMVRESVSQALGYSVYSESLRGESMIFYSERDDGSVKVIRFSPLLAKRVKKILGQRIEGDRLNKLKLSGERIISATIEEVTKQGLHLVTKYGKAFAPRQLLLKEEEFLYQQNATFFFHIYKFSSKSLIVDRNSVELSKYMLKRLLPKEHMIYAVKRFNGNLLKIYSNKLPDKQDLERIRLAFAERVKFVLYESINISTPKEANAS